MTLAKFIVVAIGSFLLTLGVGSILTSILLAEEDEMFKEVDNENQ